MTITAPAARDLSTEPGTSRAWWFLGTLAVLRNPDGAPRTPMVMELTIPPGGSPPLHVHDGLDDAFLVLDGQLAVRCGDEVLLAEPGSYVDLPSGVPHTFRVLGDAAARLLLVHADASFLELVEALGAPAEAPTLPPAGSGTLDLDTITRVNAEHGVQVVGPSLEVDDVDPALLAPRGA